MIFSRHWIVCGRNLGDLKTCRKPRHCRPNPRNAKSQAPDQHTDTPPWRPLDRPWEDSEPTDPHPAAASAHFTAESPIVAAIRNFFTGGNTLVRVGVIVLFFGVAFLLRYMAEHTHIPIEVRLTGVALASIALIVFGWRLRRSRGGYALALQGGGVGILYLIIFRRSLPYCRTRCHLPFSLSAADSWRQFWHPPAREAMSCSSVTMPCSMQA